MGRLLKSARYRPGEASNSHEIDESFNRVVGALMDEARKEYEVRKAQEIAEEKRRKFREEHGNPYTLKGMLFTEDFPVRLEETIYAHDNEEALKKAKKDAIKYRNLENYGVDFHIYSETNEHIGYVFANPIKGK